MPAVREGYSDMKQTETEALESPNQTPEGDETGLFKLFDPHNSKTKHLLKFTILGMTSYPVCFILGLATQRKCAKQYNNICIKKCL